MSGRSRKAPAPPGEPPPKRPAEAAAAAAAAEKAGPAVRRGSGRNLSSRKTAAPKKLAVAASKKKLPAKKTVSKRAAAARKKADSAKAKAAKEKAAKAKASKAKVAKDAKAAKAKAAKEKAAKAKAAREKAAKAKAAKEKAAKEKAAKAKADKAAKAKKAAEAAKEAVAAAEAARLPPVPSGGVDVLLRKKKGASPVLQLAELHRFALDTSYESVTGQAAAREAAQSAPAPLADADGTAVPLRTTRYNTGYDLVLADSKQRIRCVLAPALNEDVSYGRIRGGTAVTVDEWVFPRYNELVMGGGDPLVIVTKLSLHPEPMALQSRNQLGQLDWAFDSHAKVQPLVGHRAYYLSLNDDTVPYGGAWSTRQEHYDDDSDSDDDVAAWKWDGNGKIDVEDLESAGDYLTIERSLDLTNGFHHESRPLAQGYNDAQAAEARKRKRVRPLQGPQPPIYGVVVKKSGLTHYATIDKAGKCPFHFHVIVQDQTRTNVMVTIWTSAAPVYYRRLSVGDPVAVCKYRFKRTLNSDDPATGYAVAEIAVNPVYPKKLGASAAAADVSDDGCPFLIRKLSGEAAEHLQLDTLPSPFITLSSRHICQLQAGTVFDFVGLVTYVGDAHVTVNDRWSERTSLRSFRWLKLRDQCSTAEIAVRLDDNVQHLSGMQGTLEVGSIALLTNLKVSASRASSGERSISCASTAHSQVYRDSQMPILPQARKVKKWAASPRSQAVAAECDSLLLPFLDFRTFRGRFPRTSTLTFAQVTDACTQLRATEQRWFLVQGKLSNVSPAVVRWLVDSPEELEDAPNESTVDTTAAASAAAGPTAQAARKRRRGQVPASAPAAASKANRKTKKQSAAAAAKEAAVAEEEAIVAEIVASGKYLSTSRSFVNESLCVRTVPCRYRPWMRIVGPRTANESAVALMCASGHVWSSWPVSMMLVPSRSWLRPMQAAGDESSLRGHSLILLRVVLLQLAGQSSCTRQLLQACITPCNVAADIGI